MLDACIVLGVVLAMLQAKWIDMLLVGVAHLLAELRMCETHGAWCRLCVCVFVCMCAGVELLFVFASVCVCTCIHHISNHINVCMLLKQAVLPRLS